MKGHRDRPWVVAALIVALALTLFAIPYITQEKVVREYIVLKTLDMRVYNILGELMDIKLDIGGELAWSGHSYYVNGSGPYENLEFKCSIHVEFSNVENVKISYIKIRAVCRQSLNYHEYTLAENVAVSSSPYDNTFSTGTMAISTHLNDIPAQADSSGNYHIEYYIAVKVTGTGAMSGKTLTAEINYAYFNTYEYSAAGGAGGDGGGGGGGIKPPPGVFPISWAEIPLTISITGLVALTCFAFWWARRVIRRGARA